MIKVAITDNNNLVRQGLCSLLKEIDGIEIVAVVKGGLELLGVIRDTPVDVVVLDLESPHCCGFEICSVLRAKYPHIKVLILSDLKCVEAIRKIMQRGARAFFSKNADLGELVQAILNIKHSGLIFGKELGDRITEALFSDGKTIKAPMASIPRISHCEMKVVKLICLEYSSVEIAELLHIAVTTVNKHRSRVMEKIGCKNSVGVAISMLKHGLLSIDDF